MNIYSKLIKARNLFIEKKISKSGKHLQLEYKYFELDDIVPSANQIFLELQLVPIVSFNEELATMTIVNCDEPSETITITSPMKYSSAIVSKSGKSVVNEVQLLGASETYLRRYLYLIALDIVEPDGVEYGVATEKKTKFVTEEKREQIKENIIKEDEQANDMQIEALKKALKTLKEYDDSEETENFIQKIVLKTNHFKDITKMQAEKIIIKISDILDKVNEE